MDKTRLHFIRCPYCGKKGSHGETVSKHVGHFRDRGLYGSLILKECYKCRKVHAIRQAGGQIMWDDIPIYLQQAYKAEHFEDMKELPEYKESEEYAKYIQWKEKRRLKKRNKLKTKSKEVK